MHVEEEIQNMEDSNDIAGGETKTIGEYIDIEIKETESLEDLEDKENREISDSAGYINCEEDKLGLFVLNGNVKDAEYKNVEQSNDNTEVEEIVRKVEDRNNEDKGIEQMEKYDDVQEHDVEENLGLMEVGEDREDEEFDRAQL